MLNMKTLLLLSLFFIYPYFAYAVSINKDIDNPQSKYYIPNPNIRTGLVLSLGASSNFGFKLFAQANDQDSNMRNKSDQYIFKTTSPSFSGFYYIGYELEKFALRIIHTTYSINYKTTSPELFLNEGLALKAQVFLLGYYFKINNRTPFTPYVGMSFGYAIGSFNWDLNKENINILEDDIDKSKTKNFIASFNLGLQYNISSDFSATLEGIIFNGFRPKESSYTYQDNFGNIATKDITFKKPIIGQLVLSIKYHLKPTSYFNNP
jgi:hypothetical protein